MKLIAGSVAALLISACAAKGVDRQETCLPVPRSGLVQPATLAGGYRITLVAASPAGRRATGSIALGSVNLSVPNTVNARQVLEGAIQVAFDSLGAAVPSGVAPRDARIVGDSSAGSLMLRLEAARQADGPRPIEGSYLSFSVHRASASGFQGDWRSGDGRREVARGHFCAVRTAG